MSQQLVPLQTSAVPVAFQVANLPNMNAAAQANLQASFAIVGYRGKNWRVRYRGEEQLVLDARGVPDPVLPVIIVGISPHISKQFYAKKFTEGDDQAPDCFSMTGMEPDPASPKQQCTSCAVCPQNTWGSRVTESGKKAKACQDSRRVAVVPAADAANDGYGGPMMLRVPPMSLANLAKYCQELDKFGAQPFMVETQLGFDMDVAYPQITFKTVGWVTDPELAQEIVATLGDPKIERMLTTAVVEVTHDTAAQPESALAAGAPSAAFAQAPQPPTIPAVVAPAERPQPALPAPAVQAAAQAPALAPVPVTLRRRASPFNAAAAAPQAAQPAPGQQAAPPSPTPVAVEQAPTDIQQAPTDMEKAIDDLLAG